MMMICPKCNGVLNDIPNSDNRTGCVPCDTSWNKDEFQEQFPTSCLGTSDEYELTIQQEADLDQAAYEWVQEMKLIVNAIQGPNESKIGNIVAAAMKASCLEQIKEIKRLRTTLAKTNEHLTRVTDQGVVLAEHLTLMNAVSDEAAKALDFLSRKTCPCHDPKKKGILKNHSEGCSVRIACEALAEMKKLMSP